MAPSLAELGQLCDVMSVMVGYDHPVRQAISDIAKVGKKDAAIVITTGFGLGNDRKAPARGTTFRARDTSAFEVRSPIAGVPVSPRH